MTTSSHRACAALLVMIGALSAAPPTAAQPRDEAHALFDEGVALYDRGELAEAEDRFRRSLAIRPASSVRYNLAAVLADTGRLAEARELYLLVAADARAPSAVCRTSEESARALADRLARLTIELSGDPEGVIVRLGDRPLEGPGPHLVDPGEHVLTAERDGTIVSRRELSMDEREARTVRMLTALPSVTAEDAAPAPPTGELVEQWWLWTIVGVVVAVVAGALIGVAVDEGRYFTGNLPPGRFVVE